MRVVTIVMTALLSVLAYAWVAGAADYIVSNPADSGPDTLRQAILNANLNPGPDRIVFEPLPNSITVLTHLPEILDQVFIDGRGQTVGALTTSIDLFAIIGSASSGSTLMGLAIMHGKYGCRIESDGNRITRCRVGINWADQVFGNRYGIRVRGNHNLIGGNRLLGEGNVVSGNEVIGIYIDGDVLGDAVGNSICGNIVGMNSSQTQAWGNNYDAVHLEHASYTAVGLPVLGHDNVVCGNGSTALIDYVGDHNTFQNNFVGYCPDTGLTFPNHDGVVFIATSSSLVGGDITTLERNVIAGSHGYGVYVTGESNTIQGNFIGTDPTGTIAKGNGAGVDVLGSNNIIGGQNALSGALRRGNLISGNLNTGVVIHASTANGSLVGNYIGVNLSGNSALGNGSDGIRIVDGGRIALGDGTVLGKNIISGNGGCGLVKSGPGMIAMRGNWIGTSADGAASLRNLSGSILVYDNEMTTIGGLEECDRNIITGGPLKLTRCANVKIFGNSIGVLATGAVQDIRDEVGVALIDAFGTMVGDRSNRVGNLICGSDKGIVVYGNGASGNGFYANTIMAFTSMGIDVGNDGPGAISGSNADKQPPFDLHADASLVTGQSAPGDYVEVFRASGGSSACGGSAGLLGSGIADADGRWSVSITGMNPGEFVCATATDDAHNTSEISANAVVVPMPSTTCTLTPTTTTLAIVATPTVTPTVRCSLTPTSTCSPWPSATFSPTKLPAGDSLVVFPIPAKDHLVFDMLFDQETTVRIHVYNYAGERVAELSGKYPAGRGRLLWECGMVAPGMYVARLERDGCIRKIKICLVK